MLREVLAARKNKLGADHPDVALTLSALGQNLLEQRKWGEAEPLLREGLAIWEAKHSDDWSRFDTQSRLGDSLLGQEKYAEAEPMLLAGYDGLKARGDKIPATAKARLTEALERLVRVYDASGKKAEADRWRKQLDAVRSPRPAPDDGRLDGR